MRLILPAAVVLALCACMGGMSSGPETFHYDGGPIGLGGTPPAPPADGGEDGGADAGADAGCVGLALNTVTVIDGCFGGGGTFTGSASVNPATCAVSINTGSGAVCVGSASGPHDAFDGGCGGFSPCTSPSLPGTIVCVNGMTSCFIAVDGGP